MKSLVSFAKSTSESIA